MHPSPQPMRQPTEVVHTPAIANCVLNPPKNRAQPTFAQTTLPESPVHVCAHTFRVSNSHAVSRARGLQ